MARIFSFFLIILVMNHQAMSFEIFGIDFKTIKQTYQYMHLVYTKGYQYANKDIIKRNSPQQQLKNIMTEIKTVSKQLENFENHIDEKLDVLGKLLLNNIDNMIDFSNARSEFISHIDNVNLLFRKGMAFEENENYNRKTLEKFIDQVLHDEHNLEFSLYKIYKLLFPGINTIIRKGFITLANNFTQQNYERLCNKNSSPQEDMYTVFLILIQTHLRGFTTLTQAYSMQSIFDNSSYIQEYEDVKKKCEEQLTDYIKAFIQELNNFRADIRRCDIENPIIGENVYELEGVFRVLVNRESRIKAAVYSQKTPYCGKCEEIYNHYFVKYKFSNCTTYTSIKGCPESNMNFNGKSIRYKWFTANSQENFGHSEQCNHTSYEISRGLPGYNLCYDDICTCSVSITTSRRMPTGKRDYPFSKDISYHIERDLYIDDPKIMKISVEPQLAKVTDNMIVVGVRFILHDNGIHLQIQQNKLNENGTIIQKAVWKPVDIDSENENMHINIRYENVNMFRNIFHLDDVMIHPRLFVTGIKLHPTEDKYGFELHVHASQYDVETGRLSARQWFKPGDYAPDQQDYQRQRTKIIMDDPDNPILRENYYPDPGTNKFIEFQHTSVKKDAGYHTVPFFDGQSVESAQFPLRGVGLYHRYNNGFGGYIAPRLFTYNITWEMELAYEQWQEIEKVYKNCGLEIPPNPKKVYGDTSCETLRQLASNQIEKQNMDDTKYTTNTIRPQSTFNNNSPTLNTQHDSTKNDDARNTISKDY